MKQLKYMMILHAFGTLLSAGVNGQQQENTTGTELVKSFFFAVRTQQSIPMVVTDSSTQPVHRKQVNNPDTAYINYLTSHFMLADSGFSRGERTVEGQYKRISNELRTLHSFLQAYPSDQLIIRPIGIGKEGVYPSLTPYQQLNTLIVKSVKDPKKVLLYILILPAGTLHGQGPRILSWQLVHAYGSYQFEDILGNTGWERLLEGVKGR